jgi:ferredoxin
MKVTIDQEQCIGCGSCNITCGEVFGEDETDGTGYIVKAFRIDDNLAVGQVPDELLECVQTAAGVCAVEAIHIGA